MDPITSSFLAGLATNLTTRIVNSLTRNVRSSIMGTEKEIALKRCLNAGTVAMVATVSADLNKKDVKKLKKILETFFADDDAGKLIGRLLDNTPLDKDELLGLFNEAGYDHETMPAIDFKMAITAFEVAFFATAEDEPAMREIIKIEILKGQLDIQQLMLDEIRNLVILLKEAKENSITITNGKISIEKDDGSTPSIEMLTFSNIASQSSKWENHYLNTLISECDPLDLTPIDDSFITTGIDGKDDGRVCVSDVFTTLYLKNLVKKPGQDVAALILKSGNSEKLEEIRDKEKLVPVTAVEAVASIQKLVILGQPGGGKSTLVNYITTVLAKRRLGKPENEMQAKLWPAEKKPIPVRIILRRFAASLPEGINKGGSGLVWDYLERQMADSGCKESFEPLKDRLINEVGVIFFDGLDEVPEKIEESKRTLIKDAISKFSSSLTKCKVIVTSREYAYKKNDAWRLNESEFPVVELDLFKKDQIKMFINTWYGVVGPQKGWNTQKCNDDAANLFAAIENFVQLEELAKYPLLLTLMAQMHGKDGTLPEDRADLYKRSVDLLLAHWENRVVRDLNGFRKLEPGLVMQLGVRTEVLLKTLEQVAFDAHNRQEKEKGRDERAANIRKEDLRNELNRSLSSLDKSEEVINYIQKRAGLLIARDNNTYAFPHRTFQEYLAACCILKNSEYDTMLCKLIRRDLNWWREVFLLAAGISRKIPRTIYNMIDTLAPETPQGKNVTATKTDEVLVAADALIETNFVTNIEKKQLDESGRFGKIYKRIQDWLLFVISSNDAIAPKKRCEAGVRLGRLNDPRTEVVTLEKMEFCYIPESEFYMGDDQENSKMHLNNRLNYDYWISRYPITNAQFNEFVKAGGYKNRIYWTLAQKAGVWNDGNVKAIWEDLPREKPYDYGIPFNLGNHPVVGITWYEAIAFTNWLNDIWANSSWPSQFTITLPSEAEWEKAGRGGINILGKPLIYSIKDVDWHHKISTVSNPGSKRVFPWGDNADSDIANYYETGIGSISAAGCFSAGASPYGCEEMSGNVWEWTRSLWRKEWDKPEFNYPYDPHDGREDINAPNDIFRVLRGGSFFNLREDVRCSARSRDDPGYWDFYRGFRVVLSPFFTLSSGNSELCSSEK